LSKMTVVIFDFDGTLVDSYYMLPELYYQLGIKLGLKDDEARLFSKIMLLLEDFNEYKGIFDRRVWWSSAFRSLNIRYTDVNIGKLVEWFYDEWVNRSIVFSDTSYVLDALSSKGCILYLVSGTDGIPSFKRYRILRSGLSAYFKDIIVVGEDVKSFRDALKVITSHHNNDKIYHIDDKVERVLISRELGIRSILKKFNGPLKLAWDIRRYRSKLDDIPIVDSLMEVLDIIK